FTPDDNGTYEVTLVVTDDDGGSDTDTATIAVGNVAPSNLVVNLDDATIDENGSVTLSGSFTDPGTADTHTVVITWGDAGTSTINLTGGGRTFSAMHQYLDDNPSGTSSDAYTIHVNVTDDDTQFADASTSVTVSNLPPSATINGAPSTVTE